MNRINLLTCTEESIFLCHVTSYLLRNEEARILSSAMHPKWSVAQYHAQDQELWYCRNNKIKKSFTENPLVCWRIAFHVKLNWHKRYILYQLLKLGYFLSCSKYFSYAVREIFTALCVRSVYPSSDYIYNIIPYLGSGITDRFLNI